MRVHVRPRVLYFTQARKDRWHHIEYFPHNFYQIAVLYIVFRKLALCHKARIRLAQYRMAITRNYPTTGQGAFYIFADLFAGGFGCTQGFYHFLDPADYFLVGQAVERTSQSIQSSTERQIRVAQGRTYQMRRMRRSISPFMIGMNGQEQAHIFFKTFVRETQHVGKVGAPVE